MNRIAITRIQDAANAAGFESTFYANVADVNHPSGIRLSAVPLDTGDFYIVINDDVNGAQPAMLGHVNLERVENVIADLDKGIDFFREVFALSAA